MKVGEVKGGGIGEDSRSLVSSVEIDAVEIRVSLGNSMNCKYVIVSSIQNVTSYLATKASRPSVSVIS